MKPNRFVVFIALFLSVEWALAQHTLSGRISSKETNVALPFATVSIPDLHAIATADSLGNFHFEKLPSATYQIQIDALGYKPLLDQISIKGTTVINFKLSESTTELPEVVVTGSSKATEIKKSPLAIVSINRQYLITNLSTNSIDAISNVPGVNTITTGPNIAKPVIRGLGYNRILTLYDGMRQEGQQWGDEHGVELDSYAIDRVEIIKGPASLMYGSDAIAGVVNLIPNQPSAANTISGNITTEYQTNNAMLGGSAFITGNQRGMEWGARVSQRRAKDYQNQIDGRVYHTAFREVDANGFIGLHKKWGISHLSLSIFDNLQEIPDGSRDSLSRKFTKQITEADTYRPIVSSSELNTYSISVLHQQVQHYRAYLKNSIYFSKSRLDFNLGFQRSIRKEFSHPEAPYQNIAGLYLQLNTWTYDVKYFAPELNHWEMVVGINGMAQHNDVTKGTEFVIPSFNQFDFGSFVTVKKDFNKLNFTAGARYDVRRFDNQALYTKRNPTSGFNQPLTGDNVVGAEQLFNAYATLFNGLSGSVGFSYLIDEEWALKFNVSRGYRAPNISEISANGVHPGTNLYQIGNNQFLPEFSNQIDVGASFTSKSVNASTSLFINKIDHYIYNQRLLTASGKDSLRASGSISYPAYKFQQGSVWLYGLEGSIDFHIVKPLHFSHSLSLIYGDNYSFAGKRTDATRYVPFIPPLKYISELKYEWPRNSKVFDKLFITVQAQFTAAQNRVFTYDNTETRTAGYTLINTGIGSGIKNRAGKSIINIYVLANNVFDVAYQNHLSRLKYFEQYSASPNGHLGVYNMGRNISIKLIKNF